MKRPPLLLAVLAIAYLAFLVWQIPEDYDLVVLGGLAAILVLFFFVFLGSRIAGNILALLCCINALLLLFATITIFNSNTLAAIRYTIIASLLLAFARYLFLSPVVRQFQNKALPGSDA